MAPALTSNSFCLASGHGLYLKSDTKFLRPVTNLVVQAKQSQSPFSFGKAKGGQDDIPGDGAANKTNPFNFGIDFSKIGDAKSLVPVVNTTSFFANTRRKDPQTVFVAGATGQTGVRIVQALLRQGFTVRAGVTDLPSAQELARIASTYKIISQEESKRLNAVESSFGDAESIAKAIGPAGKVIVTIGNGEKGPAAGFVTNEALEVVRAAQLAGVAHVAVIYNSAIGGTSEQSSFNVLEGFTSFFSNLFSQSQQLSLTEFLSKVVETDVRYTLIKASLTDDYSTESSYGLVVSAEGNSSVSDFKVTKFQIASLVADIFSVISVAENKVVEVSTNPSAKAKPTAELLSAIPEDKRRKIYAETAAKKKAEEEALVAAAKAQEAEEVLKRNEIKKPSEQESRASKLAEEAQQKAAASFASVSVDNILTKAKGFGTDFSWDKLNSQFKTAVAPKAEEKSKTQLATVRGQAKARNLPFQKAVMKQPAVQKPKAASKPKSKQPEQEPEVRTLFAGLFKQETIYVDDD